MKSSWFWHFSPEVSEEVKDLLKRRLENIENPGETIKINPYRRCCRIAFKPDSKSFFIKYHFPRKREGLKFLIINSRAKAEWKSMLIFNNLGIPTAIPVGYGEKYKGIFLKDSVFISQEISHARPFRNLAFKEPELYFSLLGKLFAVLHNSNIPFPDPHIDNILVRRRGIYIIDLQKARFPKFLGLKKRIKDLSFIAFSILYRGKNLKALDIFISAYLEEIRMPVLPEEKLKKMLKENALKLWRSWLKKRFRHSFKETGKFVRAWAILYRRNHDIQKIKTTYKTGSCEGYYFDTNGDPKKVWRAGLALELMEIPASLPVAISSRGVILYLPEGAKPLHELSEPDPVELGKFIGLIGNSPIALKEEFSLGDIRFHHSGFLWGALHKIIPKDTPDKNLLLKLLKGLNSFHLLTGKKFSLLEKEAHEFKPWWKF
ncbi:MAG: lipopolysaccharide kinase InaA family protein [Thermodesulfobacteriota bacterium]|nr:lipopolysaccharide kinase InaA family protein [Thermodesulfobacteriota bacterium]